MIRPRPRGSYETEACRAISTFFVWELARRIFAETAGRECQGGGSPAAAAPPADPAIKLFNRRGGGAGTCFERLESEFPAALAAMQIAGNA